MTTAFLKRLPGAKKRRSKYNNRTVKYGDLTFHSKAELKRWIELEQLQRAGEIRNLKRQGLWPLDVNGVLICSYRDDFSYEEESITGKWTPVVEDVKGGRATQTPLFKIKSNLMWAIHSVNIRITGKGT